MKKLHALSILLVIVISLTGCWDQNIFEEIGFSLTFGLDKGENGKIKFTVSHPLFTDSIGGERSGGGQAGTPESRSETSVVEADLVREARELYRISSPLNVMGGKLQSILLSRDFALEKNISDYLELYERETQSSVQAHVVIVDGSAGELITKAATSKGKPRVGIYINDLLDRNSRLGYCPSTNIIEYDITNASPGISPIIPMIKLSGDDIAIMGTALISGDKMTGQLNTHETACLYIAMGKNRASEIKYDLPEDIDGIKGQGLVYTQKVNTKYKLQLNGDVPSVAFNIKLDVIMEEYRWGNITDPQYSKKLENSLNNSIKTCLEESFKKLQQAGCDALGIGDNIRAFHYDYWKSIGEQNGWNKVYPGIKAAFNVDSHIVRFGEIE